MQSLKFNSAFASSKAGQAFKKMQATRSARVKSAGQRLVRTLKHLDADARAAVVHDLREIADVASELLVKDDAAPTDPPAQ